MPADPSSTARLTSVGQYRNVSNEVLAASALLEAVGTVNSEVVNTEHKHLQHYRDASLGYLKGATLCNHG